MSRPVWTREMVVEALQAWFATYGQAPSKADWHPAVTRNEEKIARWRRLNDLGKVPSSGTVDRLFGSWNAALVAAGLPARPPKTRPGLLLGDPEPGPGGDEARLRL